MSQPTRANNQVATLECVVVSAQMKARREALQRLLTESSDGNAVSMPVPRGNRQAEYFQQNVQLNGDANVNRSASSATPNAVAGVFSVLAEGILQSWWQGHPARAVAQVATQLLSDQAKQHPQRLIIAGAVTGAALVILKPWRRFNLSKLLFTAVAGGSTGVLAKVLGVGEDDKANRR